MFYLFIYLSVYLFTYFLTCKGDWKKNLGIRFWVGYTSCLAMKEAAISSTPTVIPHSSLFLLFAYSTLQFLVPFLPLSLSLSLSLLLCSFSSYTSFTSFQFPHLYLSLCRFSSPILHYFLPLPPFSLLSCSFLPSLPYPSIFPSVTFPSLIPLHLLLDIFLLFPLFPFPTPSLFLSL